MNTIILALALFFIFLYVFLSKIQKITLKILNHYENNNKQNNFRFSKSNFTK